MNIYKVNIDCMRIQYILNVKNIDRYIIKDSNISFKYSIRKFLVSKKVFSSEKHKKIFRRLSSIKWYLIVDKFREK